MSGLWVIGGTPIVRPVVPRIGVRQAREYHMVGRWDSSLETGEGGAMKLIKRIAVAVGSLAALALAGGAHLRF
jgi:hypothetical protein